MWKKPRLKKRGFAEGGRGCYRGKGVLQKKDLYRQCLYYEEEVDRLNGQLARLRQDATHQVADLRAENAVRVEVQVDCVCA